MLLSISFLTSSKIFPKYLCDPMLGAYMFIIFMSSWLILLLRIMNCSSVSLFMEFVLKSILPDISIATLVFPFFLSVYLEYFFQPFTFSLCRSFFVWGRSFLGSICADHVFLSIQLPYVFWFQHLIYLYLRLLLIGTYSLPFYSLCTCLLLSPTLLLSLLKAVPLAYLVVLGCWLCILSAFFCPGNSLF